MKSLAPRTTVLLMTANHATAGQDWGQSAYWLPSRQFRFSFRYLNTYNTVLLETLTAAHLFNKFAVFCGSRQFITIFTTHSISFRSILRSLPHQRRCLPSGFLTEVTYAVTTYSQHTQYRWDLRLYIIILKMEVVCSSETSANIYQTTRSNIPEDSHVYILPSGRERQSFSPIRNKR
jgi:hypothetical protein